MTSAVTGTEVHSKDLGWQGYIYIYIYSGIYIYNFKGIYAGVFTVSTEIFDFALSFTSVTLLTRMSYRVVISAYWVPGQSIHLQTEQCLDVL